MLEELSLSSEVKELIKEEELRLSEIKLEDLPSYEIGFEKGLEKGVEKGIEKGKKLALKEIANKLILNVKDEKEVAKLLGIDENYLKELLK